MAERTHLVIVGAGAAGLMAAIWAGRRLRAEAPAAGLVVVDGARRLGAKILVSGGGRCNVTHDRVDEHAFAGSSRHAIRNVLRRFDVPRTIAFFRDLRVELEREATGKLFPVTDRARTVLEALLHAAGEAGAELRHPWRVESVERLPGGGFVVRGGAGILFARRVILATGGRSLPRSGSDGHGHRIAQALGHRLTARIFPALVPLTLPAGHFLRGLPGVAVPARVEVRSGAGRRLAAFEGPVLCTHFGLSGPAILDVSRHWLEARGEDPGAKLVVSWVPAVDPERLEGLLLRSTRATPGSILREHLPDRLAGALCAEAGADPAIPVSTLSRAVRRALVKSVVEMEVPVTGDRGFTHAEVTAGGVPLSEIRLETMESRPCPGLHLCGEICDVDGRIGGFNFQWAWASGFVAGNGAAASLASERSADQETSSTRSGGTIPHASR